MQLLFVDQKMLDIILSPNWKEQTKFLEKRTWKFESNLIKLEEASSTQTHNMKPDLQVLCETKMTV
jgi:hypothetical protein